VGIRRWRAGATRGLFLSRSRTTQDIYPRWAKRPEPFVLKFSNGTVWPGELYSPQTAQIRKLVTESKGRIGREDLKVKLGLSSDDAFRKALQRANDDGAVAATEVEVTLPPDELSEQDWGRLDKETS